jgi:polysulfide reductase chain C
MLLADAEHFAGAPEWTWYIFGYFIVAGVSGGCYVIATLLRLRGDREDESAARLGYYVALPPMIIAPLLLALDLGKPWRFWHMLWNTTPGDAGLTFRYWSPMSVGSWVLTAFGAFATISFVEALIRDRVIRLSLADRAVRLLDGTPGRVVNIIGAVLGLFVAGYTGVLLSVSNQPVWSDTWALGGLFLASGLSGSAALLILLTRYRPSARASIGALEVSERLYAVLELALIVVFALTLLPAGTLGETFGFPWILLWLVVFAGLVPGLVPLVTMRLAATGNGTVAVPVARAAVAAPSLVLLGVLAVRAVILFSVQ